MKASEPMPIEKALDNLKRITCSFSEKKRKERGDFFVPRELIKHGDFRELLALKHGLKPTVSFRIPYKKEPWQALKEWAKTNGFSYGHTTKKYIINSNRDICEPVSLSDPREGDIYASIAPSFDEIKRISDSYATDTTEFGRLMGYPECCLKFGESLSSDSPEKLEKDYLWSRAAFRSYRNSGYFSPLLNRFHGFALIPHIPCHLDCKKSKKYAVKMFELLWQENQMLGEIFDLFTRVTSFFWTNMDYVLMQGKYNGKRFEFNDAREFLSSKDFYAKPDLKRHKKLKKYFALTKKGTMLEERDDCIKVLRENKLIGAIPKKSKFECILAVPGKKTRA